MNSYMQKAIKQKNLNLWDLEKDVLGTEREQKTPPGSGRWLSDKVVFFLHFICFDSFLQTFAVAITELLKESFSSPDHFI